MTGGEFNHSLIPVYLKSFPNKSKIAAGLDSGPSVLVCRKGMSWLHGWARIPFGQVIGPIGYHPGDITAQAEGEMVCCSHPRQEASDALRSSAITGTATDLTQHGRVEGIAGRISSGRWLSCGLPCPGKAPGRFFGAGLVT